MLFIITVCYLYGKIKQVWIKFFFFFLNWTNQKKFCIFAWSDKRGWRYGVFNNQNPPGFKLTFQLYHEKLCEKKLLVLVPCEKLLVVMVRSERQNILKLCKLLIFEKCNFQCKSRYLEPLFFKQETLNLNNGKYLDKTIWYKLQNVIYGFNTIVIANLISLANIGTRVKSHFQLPLLLVLWSYWKKITHASYCRHRGWCQQRTYNQACISLHFQADQFCKGFTTPIVSLNTYNLLLAFWVYMQQQ